MLCPSPCALPPWQRRSQSETHSRCHGREESFAADHAKTSPVEPRGVDTPGPGEESEGALTAGPTPACLCDESGV